MSDTVEKWLEQLGLVKYTDAFEANDVGLDVLPHLKEEHLKELGVSLGDRVRILVAIEALKTARSDDAQTSCPSLPTESLATRSGEAERRQLTVMFCDLVDSTVLSEELDPEDLREVITSFQDACRDAIARYQGFIARYMGDGMLVYFGYPQAHEDDAERAVRAGLDVIQSIAKVNVDIGERHDIVVAVRVGVATGQVVVGDIVGEGAAEEAAAVGETPNLASRLQGAAGSNQLVVASETRRLLRALFQCEDLGKRNFKGISEPVRLWRVVGEVEVDNDHEPKPLPSGIPLVGRREELGLLARSWEACKEGHGQVVLIQGEAGIGKSRLLLALREYVADQEYVWVANRCSPYHVSSTLYPVIEHMKRVLDWKLDDHVEVKLEKLESALKRQSLPLEEAAPLYAELLSLPLPEGRYPPLKFSPTSQREQTLDALLGWVLDVAEHTPVLQVWEDLHWADPTTMELLGLFIEQSPTVPILNVLTYRPELVPPWPMHSHMTLITLNRLEHPEVEALIRHQANGKELPREVIDHIVDKTDGVPLFVEELTKTTLESDYLKEEQDRYTLTGSLTGVAIPATLQDSLMARLDRSPILREIAQLGSVIGREFEYRMLQHLELLEEPQLQSGLEALVKNELLYQRGRPPKSRYFFKHALIQEAAYQSLLKRKRQRYHQHTARLLEEHFQETLIAHPELIARHYREGGCTEKAALHSKRAGQIALERSANAEAVTHFSESLEQLLQLPESETRNRHELELRMALGPALVAARGFADAAVGKAYARARDLCEQLGDDTHLPLVLRGMQVFHLLSGELTEAQAFGEQFVDLAERRRDPAMLVGSCHALGQTLFFQGDLIAARKTVERGIGLFDPTQHRLSNWSGGQPGEQCYLYGAFSLWMLGYPDKALQFAREALRLARDLPNPANLINTIAFVSTLHMLRQEFPAARQHAESTIELSVEHKNPTFLAHGKIIQGRALVALGEYEEGIGKIAQGIDGFMATGARTWTPYFFGLQAEACKQAARINDGIASVTEALALTEATKQDVWRSELMRIKGELLAAASPENQAEAAKFFQSALDTAGRLQAKSWELRATVSLGRLWQRSGNRDKVRELVTPLYDWFTEGFETADLKQAKALLEEIG